MLLTAGLVGDLAVLVVLMVVVVRAVVLVVGVVVIEGLVVVAVLGVGVGADGRHLPWR